MTMSHFPRPSIFFGSSLLEGWFPWAFLQIAPITLLCYDYLLTLPDEIERIWKGKWSGTTFIFLLNRYTILLTQAIVTFRMLWWTSSIHEIEEIHCTGVLPGGLHLLQLIWYGTVVMFVAFRLYAINPGPNMKVFLLALFLCMLEAAIDIYYDTGIRFSSLGLSPDVQLSCLAAMHAKGNYLDPSADAAGLDTDVTLILRLNRVFSIGAYVAVLLWTWARIPGVRRRRAEENSCTSLGTMLIEDGTVFFLPLLALDIIWVIGNSSLLMFGLPVCPFAEAMTSILISRFMLNLRGVYLMGTSEDMVRTQKPRLWATEHGAILVGNLGARLDVSEGRGDKKMDLVYSIDPFSVLPEVSGLHSTVQGDLPLVHSARSSIRKRD